MFTTPTSPVSDLRGALAALAVVVLSVLPGCGGKSAAPKSCVAGTAACTCRADGICDPGLTCGGGTCQPCTPGKASCACLQNGGCDAGLTCAASTCAPCVAGTTGCPCAAGGVCDGTLTCQGGSCVAPHCAAGTLDCACDAGGGCGDGLTCGGGVCRTCTSDVAGCPCTAGLCTGLLCDGGTCRAARTCATAGCASRQLCARGAALTDATCLAECEPGFTWNATSAACDPIPGATCAAAAGGSIAGACAAANRACLDAAPAHCGECLTGFLEEAGACRAVKTCEGLACAANHLTCTAPAAHTDAVCGGCVDGYKRSGSACVALTCADIAVDCAAKRGVCELQSTGGAVCRVAAPGCTLACDGIGEDGPWPERARDGSCVCKTLPGFFYSLSGSVGTFRCDADGDGWVRDTASFALASADPAIRTNARCALRYVDRFVLHNDRGQARTVLLPEALPLYETVRNDDQAALDAVTGSGAVPRYGASRGLRAAELNSLTKACVAATADFNDNKVSDVQEWGRPRLSELGFDTGDQVAGVQASVNALAAAFATYARYSYFLELHHGWFEPVGAATAGAYHIAEKDRTLAADDNFPLRYGLEPGSLTEYTSDFWQDCPRSRDGWYADGLPPITLDFASVSAPDRAWKGMTHHSQFKCVQVVHDSVYLGLKRDGRAQQREVQSLASLGDPDPTYDESDESAFLRATMNVCEATDSASVAPRQAAGGVANPSEPVLSCTPALPSVAHQGKVLWAAMRIAPSFQYHRGCILQCAGAASVCPGTAPGAARQACYSLCGDTSASEWKALQDAPGGWRVRGGVPVIPLGDRPLEDQASGLRIQAR